MCVDESTCMHKIIMHNTNESCKWFVFKFLLVNVFECDRLQNANRKQTKPLISDE